jgi:2-C-methyl-D-erythritol 2,4-cyclodiphosphate synthase/2-C-methyl-D-erythritol 4-phosphate cytidylyltransferase
MSKIYFIVPAAGLGNRFESNLPKQYSRVGHESVIERTVNRLSLTDPEKIIIPISAKDELFASQSFSHPDLIIKASGGPSRQASVLNALNEIKFSDDDIIIVHDVVRPFFEIDWLKNLINDFQTSNGDGLIPVLEFNDSIRDSSNEFKPIDRKSFVQVQIFNAKVLHESLTIADKEGLEYSDESQAVENAGFKISFSNGLPKNIKITTPDDLYSLSAHDVFVGRGIDFHRYATKENSILKLAGVEIPSDYQIIAHSDGDIILHALADAILGAGGFRDIGHYFSDKSPENLNLDSKKIIKKTMSLISKKQLKLNNIDVTIVAQKPNLSSYISEMELSLSSILDISTDRISLKATTTEGMGEIGEENGLAVYALATLKN